jgi:hypothetical protein
VIGGYGVGVDLCRPSQFVWFAVMIDDFSWGNLNSDIRLHLRPNSNPNQIHQQKC